MARKRGFGQLTKLPSGRIRARYTGPDAALHNAPTTFDTREDAEAWLTDERRLISAGAWTSPAARRAATLAAETTKPPTFSQYATRWIAERKVKGRPLASRTQDHYLDLLRDYLAPTFGSLPLDEIAPGMVNVWYDELRPKRRRKSDTGETTRAHAYALGRAIMNTATGAHGPLVGKVNPFAVRGGGSLPSKKRVELVNSDELEIILTTIRPQWRLLVLLGLWTGLRFSEIAELRRSDINLHASTLLVRRSVSRSRINGVHVKGPKSEAGNREMHIPSAVMPTLREHLQTYVTGRDGLLFPGHAETDAKGTLVEVRHLAPSTFYGKVTCATCKHVPSRCAREQKNTPKSDTNHKGAPKHTFVPRETGWYAARTAAGHPTLHFHDLRATGATLMAQQGATEAEIQAFLGDSTPQAAQRYVRAAQSRMKAHAERMSELATSRNW